MGKKFEASIEIFHFEHDIITTSVDHDNGYVDGGILPYVLEDIAKSIKKILD